MGLIQSIRKKYEVARQEYKADRMSAAQARSEARLAARQERAKQIKKSAIEKEKIRGRSQRDSIRSRYGYQIEATARKVTGMKKKKGKKGKKGKKSKTKVKYVYVKKKEDKRPKISEMI